MTRRVGPLQIVYAGKAHPRDEAGKQLIERIFEAKAQLGDDLTVVYLENYDMTLGGIRHVGLDLWLNTPLRPLEASGTSGMKAALNGVPSFSTLDGWWIEGCVEGVTGWAIGEDRVLPQDPSHDAIDLYRKLEREILPLYYGLPYRVGRSVAQRDRAERQLLQHPAHGRRVLPERLLPERRRSAEPRARRGRVALSQ